MSKSSSNIKIESVLVLLRDKFGARSMGAIYFSKKVYLYYDLKF